MNKKTHSAAEIKKYTAAFIKFMQPANEETGGEVTKEISVSELTTQRGNKHG